MARTTISVLIPKEDALRIEGQFLIFIQAETVVIRIDRSKNPCIFEVTTEDDDDVPFILRILENYPPAPPPTL